MNKAKELSDKITEYMYSGGFMNPETMDHSAVRDLLYECREELLAVPPRTDLPMQTEHIPTHIANKGIVPMQGGGGVGRKHGWFMLTEVEIKPMLRDVAKYYGYGDGPIQTAGFCVFAQAVEATLKEKNHE